MLEAGTMLLFCAVLFASVALGWSIIPALFVGVLLFMGYGLVRRCSLRAMASRAAGSVRSAGTVVVAFVLIGVLTSLWRASGTIAFIVAHSTAVIHAATVIPLSFLLCSAMSVLVGSSFASAATMGTICMSLGLSMQANPVMLGGAILAGVYVGDRCSPVSTSALLVKQLTHTNLFNTIARMLSTGAVPFVLSCVVYVAAAVVEWLCASGGSGFGAASAAATAGSAGSARAAVSTNASSITDIGGLFSSAFDLHWLTLVPAYWSSCWRCCVWMFGCLCSPALPPRSRYAWACSTWNGQNCCGCLFSVTMRKIRRWPHSWTAAASSPCSL